MMAGMTDQDQTLEQLCSALFGSVLDPAEVAKSMPDSADLSTRDGRLRRTEPKKEKTFGQKVAIATNTAGAIAGPAAIYGAYRTAKGNQGGIPRDIARAASRKKPGGRVARLVRALDAPVSRRTKLAAGAAGVTGVALQGANWAGDAIAARELSKRVSLPPELRRQASNLRTMWNPPAPSAAPTGAAPGSRRATQDGLKAQAAAAKQATSTRRATTAGRDVGTMLSTTSGKVATGTLATAGGVKATGGRRKGYEYAPDEVAYGKADDAIEFRGTFSKFDDDKRQAFGWASIVTKDGMPVVDKQGDYISIEDLETAAYTYVHKSRVGGNMHQRDGDAPRHVSDMIESIVFTPEKIEKMELPPDFPQGWWVGYQIHDEDTWQSVRKRGHTGFSIHGRGIRKDVDVDELMGAR